MTPSPSTTAPPPPPAALARLPVALVHDWLVSMRGGEWVLAALLGLLPRATVHTLLYRPGRLDPAINRRSIWPGGLSRLPGAGLYYRWLLPMLPAAAEALAIPDDRRVVLAISHCVAHGVRPPAGAVHLNYCLSPMRYLYDQGEAYRRSAGLASRGLRLAGPRLRRWTAEAAGRVHETWAISRFVAERIKQAWDVTPTRVIYPPVRTERFTPPPPGAPARHKEFLLVSAMVPYKRVDLAIRVANELSLPLRVVGDGPLLGRMRRLAGATVAVEGRVSEERLAELYRTRRALIFPTEEDFGIVPLEAMASGMPVLGLRAGGLIETHRDGVTGAFFDEPTTASLAAAWADFRPGRLDPAAIRAHAEQFSAERFLREIGRAILEALAKHG